MHVIRLLPDSSFPCAQAAQNADGENNGIAGDLTSLVKSLADVDAAPAKLHKVSLRDCLHSLCPRFSIVLHLSQKLKTLAWPSPRPCHHLITCCVRLSSVCTCLPNATVLEFSPHASLTVPSVHQHSPRLPMPC